jgi:hypothetical protein
VLVPAGALSLLCVLHYAASRTPVLITMDEDVLSAALLFPLFIASFTYIPIEDMMMIKRLLCVLFVVVVVLIFWWVWRKSSFVQ